MSCADLVRSKCKCILVSDLGNCGIKVDAIAEEFGLVMCHTSFPETQFGLISHYFSPMETILIPDIPRTLEEARSFNKHFECEYVIITKSPEDMACEYLHEVLDYFEETGKLASISGDVSSCTDMLRFILLNPDLHVASIA